MATITTGRFFLAKKRAVRLERGGDAAACRLVLRVFDRQGDRALEAYEVTWVGAEALAWWEANKGALEPGTSLELQLLNPRSELGALGAPETHARVTRCSLSTPAHAGHQHHQAATSAD